PGVPLAIGGGSWPSGSTNKQGGDLILAGGDGTGSAGGGNVRIQTAVPGTSGTAPDQLVDRIFIPAAPAQMQLSQTGAAAIVQLDPPLNDAVAVVIHFSLYAAGTSEALMDTGSCTFTSLGFGGGVGYDV